MIITQLNYETFSWLCKDIVKIRSSPGFNLTNSWTGLSFSLWVLLKEFNFASVRFCKT